MKDVTKIVGSLFNEGGVKLYDTGIFIDALTSDECTELRAMVNQYSTRGIFAAGYTAAAISYIKGGGNTSLNFVDLPLEDRESIILVICAIAQLLEMRGKMSLANLVVGRLQHLQWVSAPAPSAESIH